MLGGTGVDAHMPWRLSRGACWTAFSLTWLASERRPFRLLTTILALLVFTVAVVPPTSVRAQAMGLPLYPTQSTTDSTGAGASATTVVTAPPPASAPSQGAAVGQASNSPYVGQSAPGQPVSIQNNPYAQPNLADSGFLEEQLMRQQRKPAPPGEFEKYVNSVLGRSLPRFGASLLTDEARGFAPSATTAVPTDYPINPGDELLIRLTGSVESEMSLVVDRNGRIFIPRVGAVTVGGVQYGDLPALLTDRIGKLYRDFKVSVAIAHLHGIRVYVTGYAVAPGSYTLSSLSTLVNAVLAAGGPSAAGSFRSIELRRNGEVVTDLDLYDLLLHGDKTHDAVLRDEDVIYIGPVGPEVAITGSVNSEAIYEAKPGETLGDLIGYAGGLSSLADDSHLYVLRLSDLDKSGWTDVDMASATAAPAQRGEIVKVVSIADIKRPLERQAIVVKLEGEVNHPGRYYLPPDSDVSDLLVQAGGLTSHAFVYGVELDRVTVREQQQAGFDEAIRNMQITLAAAPLGASSTDTLRTERLAAAQAVINQFKAMTPDGRMVLPVSPDSTSLPGGLVLQNDDRIYVPPQPTTVGVFGSVFQSGSFMYRPGVKLSDYVKLAGGPMRMADPGDMFVIRANGSVVSRRQYHGQFERMDALPGDVIFVPVKTSTSSWLDRLMTSATLIYELGFGAAALKVLTE